MSVCDSCRKKLKDKSPICFFCKKRCGVGRRKVNSYNKTWAKYACAKCLDKHAMEIILFTHGSIIEGKYVKGILSRKIIESFLFSVEEGTLRDDTNGFQVVSLEQAEKDREEAETNILKGVK